ncbi:MAG TPA: serine hydrolase domain-containing protein [Solirubrobacteraceae bacterium]|nr:serine hydrolase domain-containing protein [Solirubrobacteraceae bacterium]
MTLDTDIAPSSGGSSSPVLERAVTLVATGATAPPGVCLAVSRDGRIEFAARGVAQAYDDAGPIAAPAPVTPRTRTDVGSVTKIVATTAALMALVDVGELTLERRLSELLPWAATAPCAGATIAQLLQHRAGLWEWWPLYVSASDPEAAVRAAAALPLRYRPDHNRHYSDLGFMLLGAVVATASGRATIAEAASELVLAPLRLADTAYAHPTPGEPVMASANGDAIERRMIATGDPYPVTVEAHGFTKWRDHVLVGEVNDGNAFHAFGGAAGHAGLFSTGDDLLRFGDALLAALRGGGSGRDSAAPRARAATARRFLTPGADPGQGLGLRRWQLDGGDEAWGHTGFPGVAVAILPDYDASVALVTNRLHVHGTPAATEPMWQVALQAARDHCRRT